MVGLVIAVIVTVGTSEAQLYQWTDEQGVVHYTADRQSIPAVHRDAARVLNPPQPRAGVPSAPAPPADDPTVVPYAAGGPIVIAARLNGVPLSLLVDTGADRTVISPAFGPNLIGR